MFQEVGKMEKPIKPKSPPIFLVKIIMGLVNLLEKLQRKLQPPQFILFKHTIEDVVKNRCVYVAAELGIADLLKDGPKGIDHLAKETGTDENALYRVMRTLSSIGIFKEIKNRHFETNKIGKYLQTDVEDTIVYFTKVSGIEWVFNVWGDILQSVKNGKNYYHNNLGKNIFEWLEENPLARKTFDESMTSVSTQSDIPVVAAYDFSAFHTIIDVAGGCGSQLINILKVYPKVKGVLFELPFTIGIVTNEDVFEKAGVADRIELKDGDFFKSVPAGYDAYFLKSILHDWDDEKAVKILKNCRKAMHETSTMLIVDNIMRDDSDTPDFGKFLDIHLLAMFGGLVRTRLEYAQLLEKAGLKVTRVISTASPFCLIEAKPI